MNNLLQKLDDGLDARSRGTLKGHLITGVSITIVIALALAAFVALIAAVLGLIALTMFLPVGFGIALWVFVCFAGATTISYCAK